MLILNCPYCGCDKDETELSAGGEAHLKRFGPGASDAEFEGYLFGRVNPKGVHFERWRCASGCGKWFHAARCTATLEVLAPIRPRPLSRLKPLRMRSVPNGPVGLGGISHDGCLFTLYACEKPA